MVATTLLLCFFFFFFFFSMEAAAYDEAASLLDLKHSISHDPFNLLSSWDPSTTAHYCNWLGIACDPTSGRAISLAFPATGASLQGTLPPSIAGLTQLRTLSLSHNAFSGHIPGELALLCHLETLELQGNNFSGPVPDPIASLPSLLVLNLSSNALSGSIPGTLLGGGRIRTIDLSDNRLSGAIGVGGGCGFLTHLKLSRNFLTGRIPPEIGKCGALRSLLLDGNVLEGWIPPELGRLSELRVLDVSRNSLTDGIPKELANCRQLTIVVLTNLVDLAAAAGTKGEDHGFRGEFNAFVGGVSSKILLLPSLQVFWAPRANLRGRLPRNWTRSCSLRVLNLSQNYFSGKVPESVGNCRNLTLLDLSSNGLVGSISPLIRVPCMAYFNISRNYLTGALPSFEGGGCGSRSFVLEDVGHTCSDIPGFELWVVGEKMSSIVVVHDFSWNRFSGPLPLFSVGDGFSRAGRQPPSYLLVLGHNGFNGSFPVQIVSDCNALESLSIDLSANQITGSLVSGAGLPLNCSRLKSLEAAGNGISGSIQQAIASLKAMERLDLRNNNLSGSLPDQIGEIKGLKWIFLGRNNLTGEIPTGLGGLASLSVLDLSENSLSGLIPASLTAAKNLQSVLLDHNRLSGEIPQSFASLSSLIQLDVSFNNLSGHIPLLHHARINCDHFKGNRYLHSCPDSHPSSPAGLSVLQKVHNGGGRNKFKSLVIALVTSASIILCVLLATFVALTFGRRKRSRGTGLGRKVLVTFVEIPTGLSYDNVVRSTGNFSIRNLIGTGGFGSTYKAELVPGYLVAVKRLAIGRFQGFQQFDAEIRTLGRIQHENLVTLIGYYVGEGEMFLIYNYLPGGNLESFIHEGSGKNVQWPVIHKIAVDIAQALAYLHYSCVPRVVHRDIKPSNILLDEELNAYLSDFGLARLLEVSETHATTDVAGTFGYVAPEYATTCRVSDKADVYSFGVVLLELMSGKKSLDPSFFEFENGFNIAAWAKLLIKEGRSSEFFSTELWEVGPKENLAGMLRVASICTVDSLSERPSMKEVVEKLKQLSP